MTAWRHYILLLGSVLPAGLFCTVTALSGPLHASFLLFDASFVSWRTRLSKTKGGNFGTSLLQISRSHIRSFAIREPMKNLKTS
jgi:hypothetical protein